MFRLLSLLVVIGFAAVPFAAAQQRWSWEEPILAGPVPPPAPPPNATAPPPPLPGTGAPQPQSAWVRLCDAPGSRGKDNFGKERQVGRKTCLTYHERIDGTTAAVMLAVGVRDVDGRQQFTIMVPPNMQKQAGVRADFLPHHLWQKVQSNQRLEPREEASLKRLQLSLAFCHAEGCTAEMEAIPGLINDLMTSGGILIFAVNPNGQQGSLPVTLAGFREAHLGPPTDSVAYQKARNDLIQQIRSRLGGPADRTRR